MATRNMELEKVKRVRDDYRDKLKLARQQYKLAQNQYDKAQAAYLMTKSGN